MGDTEKDMEVQESVEIVPSLRKMAEAIREDHKHIQGYVDRVVRILEIVAEESGTTVQDALDLLEDARNTLLQYQMIS